MKKIESVADLSRIKQEQIQRQEKRGARVIVGMGTCGIAAGAKTVLQVLEEEVQRYDIQVEICQTGCIGMCEQEPLLDVQLPNQGRITYGKVTPNLVKRIVQEHLVEGNILEDAALARLTEEV